MPEFHPASLPRTAPLPPGTVLDFADATFPSRSLLAGGSPWRLVRLGERARATVDRWRAGEHLAATEGVLARTLVDSGLARPRWAPNQDRDAIDVVVPVHDDTDALERLLAGLDGFAVTVVDDGSADGAAVDRCARGAGARLVRLERNLGPAGARNAGARATTRPWLWFIDVDVVLEDALTLSTRLLVSGTDPRVGAVAPRVRGVGTNARARFERDHGPLDLGPQGGLVAPQTAHSYVPSACLLVRRDAFAEGFDETLRVGEDVDLVWRLVDAGWLVRYDADLVAGHLARATWRAWWCQRVAYGTSAASLGVRHRDRLAPVVLDETMAPVLLGLLARRLGLVATGVAILVRRIDRQLPRDVERRAALVAHLVTRATLGSAGSFARALVRSYGPLLAAAALVPRLRRPVGLVVVVGTLWRWRDRGGWRARDVPLAMADDLAYGLGVWLGAWHQRDATALTPKLTAAPRR
ncbi:MAG: mycofactocin biosynthesis glycosyltransferase MftF [Acidimicrobiales bacterium]